MRPWAGIFKVRQWFHCSRKSEPSSQVLVSVYVQPRSMLPRGLSRTSRRILLTTSIWSVIILVSAFFITYTVLLVSVDRPSGSVNYSKGVPEDSVEHARPKVKFHGKSVGLPNRSSLLFSSGSHERRQFWDPKQLYDPQSDLPLCHHRSLFIVLITSSPDHFQHRTEIRNTWCNPKLASQEDSIWQCIFLVGQTNNSLISSRLKEESLSHQDILQGSYLDTYRNLTSKVMHGLAWVSTKCESPYVLKTDDDCFVNTLLLQQFFLLYNTQTVNLYAGNMVVKHEKRKVIRKPNEKWSVSVDDYLPEYYPMYASGSGYTLSFDVLERAVEESQYIKPIPNEDAYIGIVMDHLGIQPTLSGRFTLSSVGLRLCNYLYIFVAHGIVPSMHQAMYKKMIAAQTDCKDEEDINAWF